MTYTSRPKLTRCARVERCRELEKKMTREIEIEIERKAEKKGNMESYDMLK